jgi:hypothetical protein
LLTALCAVGCGAPVEGSESSRPPSGLYSVSWQTVFDSCQPMQLETTTQESLSTTAEGTNVLIWQYGKRRQDLAWGERLVYAWEQCGATISLEVTEKSTHSMVVDHQIDWVNPTACEPLAWFDIPSSDCTVHQIATYEFVDDCLGPAFGHYCE